MLLSGFLTHSHTQSQWHSTTICYLSPNYNMMRVYGKWHMCVNVCMTVCMCVCIEYFHLFIFLSLSLSSQTLFSSQWPEQLDHVDCNWSKCYLVFLTSRMPYNLSHIYSLAHFVTHLKFVFFFNFLMFVSFGIYVELQNYQKLCRAFHTFGPITKIIVIIIVLLLL